MPRRGDEQPQQRPGERITGGGPVSWGGTKWSWSDGTALTQDEVNELGLTNADNAGNLFNDIGGALGFIPSVVDENAPGASLDTTYADAQRTKESDFIASLQQQAATGDGAWQQRFADAVRQTKNAAQALGQSDSNVGYGSALRNIGNAQSAADQRAVGDEAVLRAQSKLDARSQLGDILGNRAQMDIGQATEEARIERERRAANQASIDQSLANRKATQSATGGAFGFGAGGGGGGMSDGGEVPGRAEYFGNDERNDTQPAMLSPKEIVIPRDIAMAPDAPEKAARFVAAVKAGYDPQANGGSPRKLAEGGGIRQATAKDAGGEGMVAAQFFGGPFARSAMYDKLRDSIGAGGGGTIDDAAYRQTANQQNQLAELFSGQAAGSGPTIVPMVNQRRMDDTMTSALAAQTRGGATANDIMQSAAAAGSEAAADAGRQAGMEASGGQRAYSDAVRRQRGQEMQLSSAKQQAAWQKTLADMGLSLKNQAELRGAIGAAGQGAAAFAGAGNGGYTSNPDNLTALSNNPMPEMSDPSEWSDPYADEQGSGIKTGMAYGGVVGMADGGLVARGPSGERLESEADAASRKARDARKSAEWDEEDAGEYKKKPKKPTEQESRFSKAVRTAMGWAQKAGARVNFAEGGGVGDGGGYQSYDPYALPPRRDSGPKPEVIYVSPTPVPGTQPVSVGGTGGGGGSDVGAGGAGGAGGSSGATAMDRGSGGATGGPAGDQIPQHEAIQPRAERPPAVAALPAGVTPKGSAPPAPPPVVEPKAAAPRPAGGVASGRPTGAGADELARKAALAGYEAENQANVASAENAAAEASAIETQMNERKALVARTQQKVSEAQTRYQRAADEMARIDTSVDPGRFWATRSTGDKVIGILGLVLGALGAGPDGVNRAANMLNDAVNRDLEAQKAEHELRLKKGGARLGAAQNFYAMAREMAGDEVAAMDLAHAAALQNVAAKGKALLAQTKDAGSKANLAATVAAIEQGAAQRAATAWEKAADRALEREKIAAASGKGTAAKEVRDAVSTYRTMKSTVDELKGLIGDTNVVSEKVGSRAARMETLAGDLLLQVKDAEKLGALDKGSVAVAEQIIGDPTATFTLDSTKIAKLDQLLKQAERRASSAAAVAP